MIGGVPEKFADSIGNECTYINRGKRTMKQEMIEEVTALCLKGKFVPKNGLWEFSEYMNIKNNLRTLVDLDESVYEDFKKGIKEIRKDKKNGYSECLDPTTLRNLLNLYLFANLRPPVPYPAKGKEYSLAAVVYMCASLDPNNTIQWGTKPIAIPAGIEEGHYICRATAIKIQATAMLNSVGATANSKFFGNFILEIRSISMRNIKFNSLKEVGKVNATYESHRVNLGREEVCSAVRKMLGGINQLICIHATSKNKNKTEEANIIKAIMIAYYLNPVSTRYTKEEICGLFGMEELYPQYLAYCDKAAALDEEELNSYARMAATMDNRNIIDRKCTEEEFMSTSINKTFYENRVAGPNMKNILFPEHQAPLIPKSYPASAMKSPQLTRRSVKGAYTASTMDME